MINLLHYAFGCRMLYFVFVFQKTYYIPYFKDQLGKKHSAGGKLVDLLYNIRKRFTKSGVRPQKRTCEESNENDDEDLEGM